MNTKIKLIAFDLDGTLSQHKCPLEQDNRELLDELSASYELLVVAANNADSVIRQMNGYPVNILANYGMESAIWNKDTASFDIHCEPHYPTDIAGAEAQLDRIQNKHGYRPTDSIRIHPSGCITYSPLGLYAPLADKLAFDPDFVKRREILPDIEAAFPHYNVYICGTTSFDIVPKPFSKYFALDNYCRTHGIAHGEVIFCGDNYLPNCNDYSVFNSDIEFLCVNGYETLGNSLKSSLSRLRKTAK